MNKTFLYIVFCWLCAPLFAQTIPESENLVPNGSFEEYNWCPDALNIPLISACKYWFSPTDGTPDYFNSCANGSVYAGGYQNPYGYQIAYDGVGYAGIICYAEGYQDGREYLMNKLTKGLIANVVYHIELFTSLADLSSFASNGLCIGFSTDNIYINNNSKILSVDTFICHNQIVSDKESWLKIEFYYQANGSEKYLLIGNFMNDASTETFRLDYNNTFNYLYIDKVSITMVDFVIPNIFTPNGDEINDKLSIKNVPNGFNFVILNRWGNVVFETNKPSEEFWDGTYGGNRCTDGVYFYTLIKEDFKKNGFIHLIR